VGRKARELFAFGLLSTLRDSIAAKGICLAEGGAS
jgi:hypothetical protein